MKTALPALILLLWSVPLHAQWKKVADFVGPDNQSEYISCIYFLDGPGPPSTGFVGTESRLYRTTDGGATWQRSWIPRSGRDYDLYWVTDICFKDSLLGWFSMYGDTDACYRTTDGGRSWKEVFTIPYGAVHVAFAPENGRLFLAIADDVGPGMYVSTDFGDTWKPTIDTGAVMGWAFTSASNGFAPTNMNSTCYTCERVDSNYGIYYTSDSGSSWQFSHVPTPSQCLNFSAPLKTKKPGTYFLTTVGEFTVWRSDDYGRSWNKIFDMGPFTDSMNYSTNSLTPYDMGRIAGDLNRLYIQTDSGMYVSIDSGASWRNQGQPACITLFPSDKFYVGNGVAFAAETYGDGVLNSGGLWKEVWPTGGVREPVQAPDSCFMVVGPHVNDLTAGAREAYVKVHCCDAGAHITVEVYDNLGRAVGSKSEYISDSEPWKEIPLTKPQSAGAYYICVRAGSYSHVLNYPVY